MNSKSRWEQAQEYEKGHWKMLANGIDRGLYDLNWYKWNAENLGRLLEKAYPENKPSMDEATVLEIGSGPIGIVSYFEAKERYAIDPLCDYFSSREALVKLRDNDVKYVNGIGENLPFEDGQFDLVIIENVIDHVQNADGVMHEISRVMKKNAALYLAVNIHTTWGAFLHRIVSRLKIDKGHPHTFKLSSIRAFLDRHGFAIAHDEYEDYKECRKEDLKSKSKRDKLKALSGLSEFLYGSISTRK
jgi:ubiquinone/menaquinone biosynthesis C-methylase UbiE